MLNIAVTYQTLQEQPAAQLLAQQLKLPCLAPDALEQFHYALLQTADYLALQALHDQKLKPLIIDFVTGKTAHRQQQANKHNELIAKAVGLHKTAALTILDLTAGLGRDSFILASLGAHVTMLERSSIIAALLADGLQRGKQDPYFAAHFDLTLLNIDSKMYLTQLSTPSYPDVIYLDPMFPENNKSALVKKEMRMLRDIAGDDNDSTDIFNLALQRAKQRIVVKRHRHAPFLADTKPHYSLTGKTNRFDIYRTYAKRC